MTTSRRSGGASGSRFSPPGNRILDILYRRHAASLRAMLVRRFGLLGGMSADDIVQEAYLRLSRYDLEDAGHRPEALLRVISLNLARDALRRSAARGGGDLSLEAAAMSSGMAEPATQFHDLQLKDIILSLPEQLRDVFLLSRFTPMSYEEIAGHLGLSVKTVEWRMSKALAICAARLGD